MTPIDQVDATIESLEQLYKSVTGREAPPVGENAYAPIPPEKDPEQHVQEQLDRLLETLSGGRGKAERRTWAPCVSIWETSQEIFCCVDLPGVNRDSMRVELRHGWLEVAGERQLPPPATTNGARPRWVETPTGPFQRLIPLPLGAVSESLEAKLHDGVLEIRIPRSATVSSKTVPVG